jgi:uncharacterized cupredoxin-like copper-binding protein
LIVLLLLAALPIWLFVFGNPTADNFAVWFTLTVGVIVSAVGIPFAIIATLESFGRRSVTASAAPGFSLSSMFAVAVTSALVGMALLAVAVAASPSQSGAALESPPEGYAVLTMRNVRFVPDVFHLVAGKSTAVFVSNEDGFDHSFDIDSANVHLMVSAGETKMVMITANPGEALDFYCAVPGHRDSGMVGRVVVD